MFENYSEKARRVLFFSRYEASQMGNDRIEMEHILLGLLRENQGVVGKIISDLNIDMKEIRRFIYEKRDDIKPPIANKVDLPLSSEAKRVLVQAHKEAELLNSRFVGPEHILLSLLLNDDFIGYEFLEDNGLTYDYVKDELSTQKPFKEKGKTKKKLSLIREFSRDLTELAKKDQLDPLIGRERELRRAIQTLCRRIKNNPVLIGEPGIGKTAIVEGLAQKIVQGDVPSYLYDKKIVSLDLSSVVAGTKYRGQFEERLKAIIKELVNTDEVILFIDEIHTLIGAGSAEGSLDAAGILKPALSRGEIKCIGATTPKEYRKFIEKDRALERRFQAIILDPPDNNEAIRILEGIKERYENFHNVAYTDDAVKYSVLHSSRYIPDRYLPDKAIDILDEAGSRVKLSSLPEASKVKELEEQINDYLKKIKTALEEKDIKTATMLREKEQELRALQREIRNGTGEFQRESLGVSRDDIEQVISDWTGIPITVVSQEEKEKLLNLEEELDNRIIGQDDAINMLARSIRRSRTGVKNPHRPVGSFIFLGPTGVGKTELAKQLCIHLFGSEKKLVRFDMSEFSEQHSVSKLIGSPPGYVGFDEGAQLTDRIRLNPYSVILLDEIEKAHPNLFNILLQVLEDGQLTDSVGTIVDFRNTIIIMTSNIGARFISTQNTLGFRDTDEKETFKDMQKMVLDEVKNTFNPEFLNRLDDIIVFRSLNFNDLKAIGRLMIEDINKYIQDQNLFITCTDEACEWLANKAWEKDKKYGARPLRRIIQKYIEDKLSDKILNNEIKPGDPVFVELVDDQLELFAEPVSTSVV
ncbi:MAG: ATP-dependent Clp protease ATP-binding subunit [Acidobacteria bacterium]|nr:ATP-dependent Clp protease ATP-binding subunit [Acidobacteriota bacterium]